MTAISGAEALRAVETFLGRFVAYPSDAARIAHTLWIAHCWFMDRWESTPRMAFLSPEPGSGKTRALEVTDPLVPRPVHAVNTTPAYLFRKVSDPDGPPTILYDEIDTVFGPKAKDNEDIRGMLNAGHRRGATAGRCIVRGNTVTTEELPAYCAVALAGLNDLPDTLMDRSVVVRMQRRRPDERVEPWRDRTCRPQAQAIADQLRQWSNSARNHSLRWPDMPEGIEDRNADVWEALLAVADLAGQEWPERARVAAVTHVTETSGAQRGTRSLGLVLLSDLRDLFATTGDRLATQTVLDGLRSLPEAPWGTLRGSGIDARWLARHLTPYGISSKPIRLRDGVHRGYDRGDFEDVWARYLPAASGADAPVASIWGQRQDLQASPRPTPSRPANGVTSVTPLQADLFGGGR